MKKIFGFNPQQYGDLYMCTVAARCLKRAAPDSHLTFAIAGDYRACAPIFIDHPDIDRIHILNASRDGFNKKDIEWINSQGFAHVFNPMQDHDFSNPWWQHRHQALETAYMHGLPIGGDDGKIRLTRWFHPVSGLEKHVAISPWPSFWEGTRNPKAIQPEMAQEIVNWLLDNGWKVLQIGGADEPILEGVEKPALDYFSSLKHVLGCRAMIMGDSGFNWLLSGYDFPLLGLYSERYFGASFIHNIQPINPNAVYLSGETISKICFDDIVSKLEIIL